MNESGCGEGNVPSTLTLFNDVREIALFWADSKHSSYGVVLFSLAIPASRTDRAGVYR